MKPLDIECPTCLAQVGDGCFDKAREDWYPDGIFHASRIPKSPPYGTTLYGVITGQQDLFPDDQPKQMTLSQRYGTMEIK